MKIQKDEEYEGMLLADGFEKALLGYGFRCQLPVAVYDYRKCIKILMKSMSEEDAEDFMNYNVLGSYVGEQTPIFI